MSIIPIIHDEWDSHLQVEYPDHSGYTTADWEASVSIPIADIEAFESGEREPFDKKTLDAMAVAAHASVYEWLINLPGIREWLPDSQK